MKVIYLDQWVYVRLLRTYNGASPEYPKYVELCKDVIESSNKGVNRFPFSIAHLHETIKRTKLDSRKELFKFIFDLSKFNTIRPWIQVVNPEIRNAILTSLGRRLIPLSSFVFGDELGHCFGRKAGIESTDKNKAVPEEVKVEILSAYKNSELMADALSKDKMLEYIEGWRQQDDKMVNELEELRLKEYSHPDKKKRKDISDARFFITIIRDPFIQILSDFNLDFNEYTKKIFSSKEAAESFLKSIPTAYVFHVLNEARNMNSSRPIKPNDLWDLSFLAIAVPYCDIVVTEREWAQILNQKKIGELYNTKILYSLEELGEILKGN